MDFHGGLGYLIHELAQKLTADSDLLLRKHHGIGFSQYKVLFSLQEKQGIEQKTIAKILNQTEASISRQIGVLIDKDLVEIGETEDNRKHLIFLTPIGDEIVIRSSMTLNNYLAQCFQNLDDIQISQFQKTLIAIRRNVV